MEYSDTGKDVRLSKLALDILLDQQPDSVERKEFIKQAAMTPKIHKELWGKWQDELPSDATILTYLIRDRGFNEPAAKDLLVEYKDTLSFAKVSKSDKMPSNESGDEDNKPEQNGGHEMTGTEQQPLRQNPAPGIVVEKILAGERSFLSGPLSKDGAAYRLIVSGSVGSKELGKLIKLLTLQKEILEDEDEESAVDAD